MIGALPKQKMGSWRRTEIFQFSRTGYEPTLVDCGEGFKEVRYMKQGFDMTAQIKEIFGDDFHTVNYRVKCELEAIEALGVEEFNKLVWI
jgi:hypothetical protein